MKRFIVVATVFLLLPLAVVAQVPDISWYTNSPSTSRYEISNANQLAGLATLIGRDNFDGKRIYLTDNIDLFEKYGPSYNGGKGWIPIGSSGSPFMGTFYGSDFYGNKKIISGLYINDTTRNCVGLFGVLGKIATYNHQTKGTVGDVRLVNVNVTGRDTVGALVGFSDGNVGGCSSEGTVNGGYFVGGVVGLMRGSGVGTLYSAGKVKGSAYVGGVVGGLVGGCVNTGCDAGSLGNCGSTASVSGSHDVGGALGIGLENKGWGLRLDYFYATGEVVGYSNVGGIAGSICLTIDDYMRNCAALNPIVAGVTDVGRVVGNLKGIGGVSPKDKLSNVAFDGIIDNFGSTSWINTTASGIDGRSITANVINADSTLGIGFWPASDIGWKIQRGKLPGLDAPIDMPEHLSLLAIARAPTITAQPPSATVTGGIAGATHNLIVSATAAEGGALSYQWYRNTTASNAGGTAISGATSATYPAPLSAVGTFHYYVIVTNTIADNGDGGRKVSTTASNVATLTVVSRVNAQVPSITAQPQGGTATVGATRFLTVTASVTSGTLSYQWYSNTTANNTGGTAISGATSATYPATMNVAGTFYYYAVVTNKITDNGDGGTKSATVTSSVAILTVQSTTALSSPDRAISGTQPSEEASTAVIAPVNPLTAEFTAGPNPADKSLSVVNFYRNGSRVAYATLSIYDAAGNVVRKIRVVDDAVGSQTRRKVSSWNLRDTNGRPVPGGTYLVKGVLKTSGGKREKVSLVLGVR